MQRTGNVVKNGFRMFDKGPLMASFFQCFHLRNDNEGDDHSCSRFSQSSNAVEDHMPGNRTYFVSPRQLHIYFNDSHLLEATFSVPCGQKRKFHHVCQIGRPSESISNSKRSTMSYSDPYIRIQDRKCINILKRMHMGHAHDHHHHHHVHDAGDTGEEGERVSRLGFIADICLCAGKGFAGYVSGSTAVLADAAHSMSDVVLSGVALWIFKAARAPKDQMHPYGHGKFETLGALGISSILLLTGGGIAWHALEALMDLLSTTDGNDVISAIDGHNGHNGHADSHLHSHVGHHHHGFDKEHQTLALAATLVSICVKEGLYWVTKKVGDARGSELLKANAWHHRSDAISSFIALVGVGGAMLGWSFFDPLAGLLVSGMIVKAGLQTGYHSLHELVDSALPESELSSFRDIILGVSGVKGCHALRGRRAGSSIHLDVHIEVDPWLSVSAAHMIGEEVRAELRRRNPFLEDIFIHVDPDDAFLTSRHPKTSMEEVKTDSQLMAKKSNQQQDVERAVRELLESEFLEMIIYERVRCHFLQGRLILELEVSMKPSTMIRDAIQLAQCAEKRIMEVCPEVSAVETQLRLTRLMSQREF